MEGGWDTVVTLDSILEGELQIPAAKIPGGVLNPGVPEDYSFISFPAVLPLNALWLLSMSELSMSELLTSMNWLSKMKLCPP